MSLPTDLPVKHFNNATAFDEWLAGANRSQAVNESRARRKAGGDAGAWRADPRLNACQALAQRRECLHDGRHWQVRAGGLA
ncbi:MAG: hypothetical protein QM599_02575 [Pseudoxanthomonas sp.]